MCALSRHDRRSFLQHRTNSDGSTSSEWFKVEEERKIIGQSVDASDRLTAARKDCRTVCRVDELNIHSSPGVS